MLRGVDGHERALQQKRFLVFECNSRELGCDHLGHAFSSLAGALLLSILTERALLLSWTWPVPMHTLYESPIDWQYHVDNRVNMEELSKKPGNLVTLNATEI